MLTIEYKPSTWTSVRVKNDILRESVMFYNDASHKRFNKKYTHLAYHVNKYSHTIQHHAPVDLIYLVLLYF